jgi:hypothetical protein
MAGSATTFLRALRGSRVSESRSLRVGKKEFNAAHRTLTISDDAAYESEWHEAVPGRPLLLRLGASDCYNIGQCWHCWRSYYSLT